MKLKTYCCPICGASVTMRGMCFECKRMDYWFIQLKKLLIFLSNKGSGS